MTSDELEHLQMEVCKQRDELESYFYKIENRKNGIGLSFKEKFKIWFFGDSQINTMYSNEFAMIREYLAKQFYWIIENVKFVFKRVIDDIGEIFNNNSQVNILLKDLEKNFSYLISMFEKALPEFEKQLRTANVWSIPDISGVLETGEDFKKNLDIDLKIYFDTYFGINCVYFKRINKEIFEQILKYCPKVKIKFADNNITVDFSKLILISFFIANIDNCNDLYFKNKDKYDEAVKSILEARLESKISNLYYLLVKINYGEEGPYRYLNKVDDFLYMLDGTLRKELPAKNVTDKFKDELSIYNDKAKELLEDINYDRYKGFVNEFENWLSPTKTKLMGDYLIDYYVNKCSALKYFYSNQSSYGYNLRNLEGNSVLYYMLSKYKKLIFFDTETTGLDPEENQIIEFSYEIVEGIIKNEKYGWYELNIKEKKSIYIKTKNGQKLSSEIVNLTKITDEKLQEKGIDYTEAKNIIYDIFSQNQDGLFIAYNAVFDVSFIIELLEGKVDILGKLKFLDVYLSIKERYAISINPNKLNSSTSAKSYKLGDIAESFGFVVGNSSLHNAENDVNALKEVTKTIEKRGMGEKVFGIINRMYYPTKNKSKYLLPQIEYVNYYY